MKNKTLFSLFLVLILVISCTSEKTKVTQVVNGVRLESSKMNVKVQFYGEKLARVTKWSANGSSEKKSLMVLNHELPSIEVSIEETSEAVELKTSALNVSISKADGNIKYTDLSGNVVLQEQGSPLLSPVVYSADSGFTVQQNFKLTADEGVYGLGQHQYGYFNYRGKEVKLVQSNTDAVNPFLISTNHYGILWDNYSKTVFKDDEQGASLWSDMGSNIDYYFVFGENMDAVISGYRTLTGKAPMYGKYAYGYWQSKEHYDTQEELLTVARKYRKLKIPIDNMIQDWDYWNGNANWSGMFFDKTLFPDPQAMMDELHKNNFHAIISIWPALGPNTEIYKEMGEKGHLIDVVGWAGFKYMDTYNPGANALYWKYLRGGIYSKGLDGWWIDSTEPDVVNALTKESTEYEMKKMGSCYLGSWARYLNSYSLVMTDDIHKYWREETSDRRAYILTRSCFAGQQRNAATTWSGDIGASWEVYRNQISAGTNHCMSGIPYWTFDIGAFVLGAYEGVFMTGGKNPAYQELYNRMFQLGAFSPIFRSHGSETPREIWEMGEFTDGLIKFDNLRYRLMPYIYSLAWKVSNEDYTYMRGLPMDFPEDKNTYNIDDQFMFGPSFLVCPITDYMYHTPPQASVLVGSEYFLTNEGKPGLNAKYYKDNKYKVPGKEQVDSCIDVFWYAGRPDYVTDSMYAIHWEGKLIPKESGKHQFHLKSFDAKRILLDGDTLPIVYTSTEQYTAIIELEAGKEYNFVVETENNSTGAARMRLFWKDPTIFAKEAVKAEREKTKEVYLPAGTIWFDFWTGKTYEGGQSQVFDAPKDLIPLLVKAGSIIPMGPFVQYATEKPDAPYEIRIYAGADGNFVIYEDENDNYNYEKGAFAEVELTWNNQLKQLTIGDRKGTFKGLVVVRKFNIVLVDATKGIDIALAKPDKTIDYNGTKQVIQF
jgi:alpha-D-xyloside xylohydrolase